MKSDNASGAYTITAACLGIQGVGIGVYFSYGVFFPSLISEFGWSRATLAGASSLAFFLMGFFSILVGRLNDKIGPRVMMTVTGLILGLAHLLMSQLSSVWHLYLFYGIIAGIGLSAVDVIPLSTIARWFGRRRGAMTGIVKVGTGAGQMIIPMASSFLITGFGWRNAYLFTGLSVCVVLVVFALMLKRNPEPVDIQPGDEARPKGEPEPKAPDPGLSFRATLKTPQFRRIFGMNFCIVFCLMLVVVHVVPYARDMGISPTAAAGVLSTIGGVSILGRLVAGFTIDRIGSRRVMMFCFVLLIGSLVWLQTVSAPWMLYLFALVYGLAHGGFFTAISPIVAEFFGVATHGSLFGIVLFAGTFGGAIGPFLAGYIFDLTADYALSFYGCMGTSALGFWLVYSLKPIE